MNELFESTKNIPQPIPLVSYGEIRLVFQISIDLGITVSKITLGRVIACGRQAQLPCGPTRFVLRHLQAPALKKGFLLRPKQGKR